MCLCLVTCSLKVSSNQLSLQCLQDAVQEPLAVVMKLCLLRNQDGSVSEPADRLILNLFEYIFKYLHHSNGCRGSVVLSAVLT